MSGRIKPDVTVEAGHDKLKVLRWDTGSVGVHRWPDGNVTMSPAEARHLCRLLIEWGYGPGKSAAKGGGDAV